MVTVYFEQGSWLRDIKRFFQWLGLGTAVAMSEATDGGEEAAEDADGQAAEASDAAAESAASVERPRGVPEDWIETETDDGGRQWTNPENIHDSVRTSPAKPDSPWESQRVPNVKRHTPEGYRDAEGNIVPKQSADSHIPLDQFRF